MIALTQLPGIGPVRAERLNRIGVVSGEDLVRQLPARYEDRTRIATVNELEDGAGFVLMLRLQSVGRIAYLPGRRTIQRTRWADATGTVEVVWHNQPYLGRSLQLGAWYCVYGTYDAQKKCINNPKIVRGEEPVLAGIEPIYPLTRGLRNTDRRRATEAAFSKIDFSTWEILPEALRRSGAYFSVERMYRTLHAPPSKEALKKAWREWSARERLVLALAIHRMSMRRQQTQAPPLSIGSVREWEAALDFSLTSAQKRSIEEIFADLEQRRPMNRLLQGDVGSGKTVVALAGAYRALCSGYQAVLMAPTEVLARQHAARAEALFARWKWPVFCLTGSMSSAQRVQPLRKAASGKPGLWIGTHALFQEGVRFSRLGLVITDEQHRFGVRQRKQLEAKEVQAHVLVLSATPIPRTLMLSMYGDLAISRIDELPKGRKPIATYVVDERYEKRLMGFLDREMAQGHQAYLVCPLIEEMGSDLDHWSVEQVRQRYGAGLPHRRLAVLHGRMTSEEKQAVLQRFAEGSIDLLISTTVIEVGIDVPNATVMVVGAAERFGLAQLHQLRGRVGRGTQASHCVLVAHAASKATRERLRFLETTEDGLAIARKDLEWRGAGERFGLAQHGTGTQGQGFADVAEVEALVSEWLQILSASEADWPPALSRDVAEEEERLQEVTLN